MGVGVKAPFSKITKNPYVWSLAIDGLDLVGAVIDGIAIILGGPLGIGTNTAIDVMQSGLCLAVFNDPTVALLNYDIVLPPGLDLLPTHTANVYIRENLIK